jgi:hypothetical protein
MRPPVSRSWRSLRELGMWPGRNFQLYWRWKCEPNAVGCPSLQPSVPANHPRNVANWSRIPGYSGPTAPNSGVVRKSRGLYGFLVQGLVIIKA